MEATFGRKSIDISGNDASPELPGQPITYLLSQYPALTHTYLLREVLALRKLGLTVEVASIRSPDRPPELLNGPEREEAARTFYVKAGGISKALKVHIDFFARHPAKWLSGLRYTLRLSRKNPGKLVSHLYYFVEAVIVGSWMEARKSKHVHTHFVSTVGILIKKLFPVTFSMTIHGPEEFDDAVGFHLAEKMAAADFVFSISHYSQSQLMRASHNEHWHKIQVVPLGVDPNTYQPASRPVVEGVFRLICVARLAPVKAQSILLEAVAQLIAAGRRIELSLVGGGPDRERLENKARELGISASVVFHGGVSPERVIELLKEAHVCVLASFAEGVPVSLMEAMALEVPCVATWVMGVPELICDQKSGLLVAPSDVSGLAIAIDGLIDDAELCLRLGQSGRKHILNQYNLQLNAETMANVFRARLG